MLEVNPIPQSITTDELEQNVCHALSMTGTTIKPEDIHASHQRSFLKLIRTESKEMR